MDTFSRVLGVFVHYTDEQASPPLPLPLPLPRCCGEAAAARLLGLVADGRIGTAPAD